MKRRRLLWIILSVFLILITGWTIWENCSPQITETVISSARLPDEFFGYRIAHISDFHNAQYGAENQRLLEMLRTAKPDIIAITGDFIDSRRTDFDVSLRFAQEAIKIAPVYYCIGNHEARLMKEFPNFEDKLIACGVNVLRNGQAIITRNDQTIRIVGVDDPLTVTRDKVENEGVMRHFLSQLELTPDTYTILLTHRPELFKTYCDYPLDLILSGHNHGGLIQIPGLGGLFANEEFFPMYDSGLFTQDNTVMYISRGIGNSSYTFRINNRPELPLLILE